MQGANLDPELAASWYTLLAHSLVGGSAERRQQLVGQVARILPQHFGFAVASLQRQEDDLARALLAFLRGSLVCLQTSIFEHVLVCFRESIVVSATKYGTGPWEA